MKEKLEEIYSGLTERLKSSFLITFTIVWIVHNWKYAYVLFSFDSSIALGVRLDFIEIYTNKAGWWGLFWVPVFFTFISLFLFYCASFLAEGINLIYSKWARAYLYMQLDSNKLKTVEAYEEIDNRRKNLQDLVRDLTKREEEAVLKLRDRESELNGQLGRLTENMMVQSQQTEQLNKDITAKNSEINQLKNELAGRTTLEHDLNDYQILKTWLADVHPKIIENWNNILNEQQSKIITGIVALKKLSEIFTDDWRLTYMKDGKTGHEKVKIEHNSKYIVNNKHLFNIDNVIIDFKTNQLKLSKVKLDGTVHSIETLTIGNDGHIVGTDSLGYSLDYIKLIKFPNL